MSLSAFLFRGADSIVRTCVPRSLRLTRRRQLTVVSKEHNVREIGELHDHCRSPVQTDDVRQEAHSLIRRSESGGSRMMKITHAQALFFFLKATPRRFDVAPDEGGAAVATDSTTIIESTRSYSAVPAVLLLKVNTHLNALYRPAGL